MTTVIEATATSTLRALARREIVGYSRSPLFLIGIVGTAAVTPAGFTGEDDGTSSTMNMIAPAAFIGLLGVIVMGMLTTRSDRAAAAAGAVSASESTRTLALLAAVAVPLATALAWFAAAVAMYVAVPPSAGAVPFGPIDDQHVLLVMFALGVMPAVGGPVLGLVVARWLPWRGASVVTAVLLVFVSILMQGNFPSTWRWRVVWPWTYWYGPLGWESVGGGQASWVALPGSPLCWVLYLVALCVLGALVALLHDPEADRRRLRTWTVLAAIAAGVALALTMLLGLDEPVRNSVPGVGF